MRRSIYTAVCPAHLSPSLRPGPEAERPEYRTGDGTRARRATRCHFYTTAARRCPGPVSWAAMLLTTCARLGLGGGGLSVYPFSKSVSKYSP